MAKCLLKGVRLLIFYFLNIFLCFFSLVCIKKSNYFKGGLCLFKGLCLLFLPNVPGAMFIQGGTFIPDSRVTKVARPDFSSFRDG